MKILLAGDWHSDLHEEPVRAALMGLGHDVTGFAWHRYFAGRSLYSRAQERFIAGPLVARLNRDLLAEAERVDPDVVWLYRGTHLLPGTVAALKRVAPRATLVGYSNDDPFSPVQPSYRWRHFLAAVPLYDLMLAYRPGNVEDLRAKGARRVELLRSWYLADRHRPMDLEPAARSRFSCDVVFAGHFEPDGRQACVEELLRQGVQVRVFGPEWRRARKTSELARLGPIEPVRGDDYVNAIRGAKLALCFLSKLNRDGYTRRCFEIPATGTMMVAERTKEMEGLFREGEEAEFFSDAKELAEKVRRYLADDSRRTAVAAAGRERVRRDGHDVGSRMRQVMAWVGELRP